MNLELNWLYERIVICIPLVLSLSVHEWAHAAMAYRLGDDTAKQLGRLTLDPTKHIDLVGTLICPLLGLPLGWAKPVPFVPTRFSAGVSMRFGTLMVALAGPAANLFLCGTALVLTRVVNFGPAALHAFLQLMLSMNLGLALFNLIPLPPLDGHYVADYFMPSFLRPFWDKLVALGPGLLIALIMLFAWLMGRHS